MIQIDYRLYNQLQVPKYFLQGKLFIYNTMWDVQKVITLVKLTEGLDNKIVSNYTWSSFLIELRIILNQLLCRSETKACEFLPRLRMPIMLRWYITLLYTSHSPFHYALYPVTCRMNGWILYLSIWTYDIK